MKTNIDKFLVYEHYTIKDVLKTLDLGAKGIVIVVDEDKKVIGTITDGDVRRALLKGATLEEKITSVIHYNPICVNQKATREEIKDIFIKKAIKQLLVVNDENVIVDLLSINDILIPQGKENPVVIMAGGLGSRLKNLTKEIPKPMLKVGNDPILYHIISNFKARGFNKFFITVNYKAEIIENYFQDGVAHGVKIEYLREDKRMGTAGGIRLAKGLINTPFFVINGDVFTNLDMEKLMEFHKKNNNVLTIAAKRRSIQIPYGVIETDGQTIKAVHEKPVKDYLINGGIYCLNPEIITLIPQDTYYEITDLINLCIHKGLKVGSYEIKGYWMDIGRLEDYTKANQDFGTIGCVSG